MQCVAVRPRAALVPHGICRRGDGKFYQDTFKFERSFSSRTTVCPWCLARKDAGSEADMLYTNFARAGGHRNTPETEDVMRGRLCCKHRGRHTALLVHQQGQDAKQIFPEVGLDK